jgi:hypothetical protein
MITIIQDIAGYAGQVQLLTLNRADNAAAVVVSPALPQPFSTSDDATFTFSFTDPDGDCALGYVFTYSVTTLSPGASFPTITTLNGSTGPNPTGTQLMATDVTVTGAALDENGNFVPNVAVAFRAKYSIGEVSATTNGNGVVTISLPAGVDYCWRATNGSWNYFTVPTAGTLNLGNLVGDWQ